MIHKILKSEIKNLSSNPDYWGTEKNVANENFIFDWFLNTQAVNQNWFDNRPDMLEPEEWAIIANRISSFGE